MTFRLERDDFRALLKIVERHPSFANVRDRRRLLDAAFEGEPRGKTVIANIDIDGNPRDVAVEVVSQLQQFGGLAYGRSALGVFLNELLDRMGEAEDEAFIRALFARYPLDRPVIAAPPLVGWKGGETSSAVDERIIGENTLRDIRYLEQGLRAARAVIRIALADGTGSGFMIAPNLIMTNHHVIHSQEEAATAAYWFNFQLDVDGRPLTAQVTQTAKDGLFYTQPELDFTVVQIDNAPDFGSSLPLRSRDIQVDDRVAIIQHPGGNFKKIAMQGNFVAYADARVVQYYTSTMPGSSGSPVFNEAFEVVAIHHQGGMLEEPGTNRRYFRNQGVTMRAVLGDLKQNAAAIYAACIGAGGGAG